MTAPPSAQAGAGAAGAGAGAGAAGCVSPVRVLILGGGPTGLLTAANLCCEHGLHAEVTLVERNITTDPAGAASWKPGRRRPQVVTLQDAWLQKCMPDGHVGKLLDALCGKCGNEWERVWPGSHNIAIADVEDRLLLLLNSMRRDNKGNLRFKAMAGGPSGMAAAVKAEIEAWLAQPTPADVVNHVVIAFGGSQPEVEAVITSFTSRGSWSFNEPLYPADKVVGLRFRFDRNIPSETWRAMQARWTAQGVSQTVFLANACNRRGLVNVRVSDDQYEAAADLVGSARWPEQEAFERSAAHQRLGRVLSDALAFFAVPRHCVEGVTRFDLRQRMRNGVVEAGGSGSMALRNTLFWYVGDAAMQAHFWLGRGMNSGFWSARQLAMCISFIARSSEPRGRPTREVVTKAMAHYTARLTELFKINTAAAEPYFKQLQQKSLHIGDPVNSVALTCTARQEDGTALANTAGQGGSAALTGTAGQGSTVPTSTAGQEDGTAPTALPHDHADGPRGRLLERYLTARTGLGLAHDANAEFSMWCSLMDMDPGVVVLLDRSCVWPPQCQRLAMNTLPSYPELPDQAYPPRVQQQSAFTADKHEVTPSQRGMAPPIRDVAPLSMDVSAARCNRKAPVSEPPVAGPWETRGETTAASLSGLTVRSVLLLEPEASSDAGPGPADQEGDPAEGDPGEPWPGGRQGVVAGASAAGPLLALLQPDSGSTAGMKEYAARALADLAFGSNSSAELRAEIVGAGAIELLVELLWPGAGSTAGAQEAAAWALANLAASSEEHGDRVVVVGAIKPLVALLRPGATGASSLVANHWRHDGAGSYVARKGQVAARASSSTPMGLIAMGRTCVPSRVLCTADVQKQAATALAALASGSEVRKDQVAAGGAILVLVALLRPGAASCAATVEQAARAICALASGSEIRKDQVAAAGAIQALVQLLRPFAGSSVGSRRYASEALVSLAAGSEQLRDKFAAGDTVQVLVHLLRPGAGSNAGVRGLAATVLANLAIGSERRGNQIAAAGAIDLLAAILRPGVGSPSGGAQEPATKALRALATVNKELRAVVVGATQGLDAEAVVGAPLRV